MTKLEQALLNAVNSAKGLCIIRVVDPTGEIVSGEYWVQGPEGRDFYADTPEELAGMIIEAWGEREI